MSKGKTVMISGGMICLNCGDRHLLPMPIGMREGADLMNQFSKRHEKCKPGWQWPQPHESLSTHGRQKFWLIHGQRGSAADVMFEHLSGHRLFETENHTAHPDDADSLSRCYLLLKMVPEWNSKPILQDLVKLSPAWKKIYEHWDKLMDLMEQWISGKSTDIHDYMKNLNL